MAKKSIKIEYACQSCGATGLYIGFAERDGAAVACSDCKGTGKAVHHFQYDDFTGRKPTKNVKRVYQVNPGITIGSGRNLKGQDVKLEDFGGIPYEDWANGKKFPPKAEMRKFTCPAWWYQAADYDKKPQWKECTGQTFASCPNFCNKAKCWERWDKEFGKKP